MKLSSGNIFRWMLATLVVCVSLAFGQSPISRAEFATAPLATGSSEAGLASYYADKYHGKPTASGEVFDTNELTAAHRTLPFGTRVRVTHLENHRSVIVRINDRGPFVEGRVIDVSRAAAEELQFVRAGLAKVRLEIIPTLPM